MRAAGVKDLTLRWYQKVWVSRCETVKSWQVCFYRYRDISEDILCQQVNCTFREHPDYLKVVGCVLVITTVVKPWIVLTSFVTMMLEARHWLRLKAEKKQKVEWLSDSFPILEALLTRNGQKCKGFAVLIDSYLQRMLKFKLHFNSAVITYISRAT